MSLERLARRMDLASRQVEVGTVRFVRSVVTEIGRILVPATPVRTGFARGNWRPSLNAPAPVPVQQLDATGAATIARIEETARRFSLGDTFFLVNRTPYIVPLNRGSSPQAPPGFVEDSVRRGFQAARRPRIL